MSNVISQRKDAHLDLVLTRQVEARAVATGLGPRMSLEYDALPELDLQDVDLSVTLLGKRLRAPVLVGAMTGGSDRAGLINARLARAAQRAGVGMALGSQRAMVVDPALTGTYAVRQAAPSLPLLLGNLGAVQLNLGMTAEQLNLALEAVAADAVYLHVNPLQEAIQPEGDTCFSGLLGRLEAVIPDLRVPCLVKEVGAGISRRTARKLAGLPIAGVEASGVGGTSWALVESLRAPAGSAAASAGLALAGFGVSTADSIVHCRQAMGDRLVLASGGIRSGLDAAVALALGADAVALARPLLQAAEESEDAVLARLEALIQELRILLFCCGARTPGELRGKLVVPGAAPRDSATLVKSEEEISP